MRVCLLVWMHVWTRKVGCTCVGVWVSACVGTCVCGFLRVCRYLCVHTCAHVGTCACGYFYLHVRAFHMGHRASMASRICAPVLLLIGHSTDATATQADACAYCDLCQSGLSDPPVVLCKASRSEGVHRHGNGGTFTVTTLTPPKATCHRLCQTDAVLLEKALTAHGTHERPAAQQRASVAMPTQGSPQVI